MSIEKLSSMASSLEINPEEIENLTLPLIMTGILCVFLALFGFKFLKIEICVFGALFGYTIGAVEIANFVGDALAPALITVISIALAIIGVLLSAKVYKIMVFIYAAYGAYYAGTILFSMFIEGLQGYEAVITLLSVLFAIVSAYITCKFFKPIFIILTSVGGMVLALVALALVISPESETVMSVMMIVGLILGVFAAIKQFKSCKDIEF